MRQRIQIIIYSWILILCADLNAKAIETLVPEKALVAEKIRYELKWDNGEIKNVRFPEIGLHFSEDLPDIPRFEISYSEKKEALLRWTLFLRYGRTLDSYFLGGCKR